MTISEVIEKNLFPVVINGKKIIGFTGRYDFPDRDPVCIFDDGGEHSVYRNANVDIDRRCPVCGIIPVWSGNKFWDIRTCGCGRQETGTPALAAFAHERDARAPSTRPDEWSD